MCVNLENNQLQLIQFSFFVAEFNTLNVTEPQESTQFQIVCLGAP